MRGANICAGVIVDYTPALTHASERPRRLPRNRVDIRWLVATILMATAAAALLMSALYAALNRDMRFAEVPLIIPPFRGTRSVVASGRGDRLSARATHPRHSETAIHLEQLSLSGKTMRAFTHLTARLAEVRMDASTAADTSLDDKMRGSDSEIGDRSATTSLPPEILFGTSRPSLPATVSAYASLEPFAFLKGPALGKPINVTVVPQSPAEGQMRKRLIVAKAGDRLAKILKAVGFDDQDAGEVASSMPTLLRNGKFAGGEMITVLEPPPDKTGTAVRPMKITVARPGSTPMAVALADDGHYEPVIPAFPKTRQMSPLPADPGLDLLVSSDETLRDSLYGLGADAHLDPTLTDQLVRLCSHGVDLDMPVSATDRLNILYDEDKFGRPELAFIALTAAGRRHRYYRFTAPDDGSTDYYDSKGRSITKFLLRKPVVDGRLGDGFGWRIHPILHDRRFHEGVDYAAPYGSPIMAAGAGTIEEIGQEWGYGKFIRVRHDLGYETTYAHVSRIARGLRVGSRVRQGQTIAYVGSTGLSTGPHLYYEVRINGHRVDPLRIRLFSGRVLRGDMLRAFTETRQRIDELIGASAVALNKNPQ